VSSPESNSNSHTRLTQAIHAASARLTLVATGGGSLAFSTLLTTPGASRSVLEAVVPYSSAALCRYLQARPEQFCSELTARQMAMAAYQRALAYQATEAADAAAATASGGVPAGVGCTCSLASDRPKRGAHRIHCAAQTSEITATASLELTKDARSRLEEEEIAAAMILNLAALVAGVAERAPVSLKPGEQIDEHCVTAPLAWRQLFMGERKVALALGEAPDDKTAPSSASENNRRAIFPGAFHPLHAGHLEMAQVAQDRLQTPVEWEISIANVDKPPIDYREMELRSQQFAGDKLAEKPRLWFTWAPTFAEKSELFPRSTFLVGADTISRIAEPRYYHDEARARDAAVAKIAGHGCRFLVFGRTTESGFQTSADLDLPPSLAALCEDVPAAAFHHDISSTEIRRQAAKEGQP
jgi:nicotinamide mononucleotide (NMN) deamidase PncC